MKQFEFANGLNYLDAYIQKPDWFRMNSLYQDLSSEFNSKWLRTLVIGENSDWTCSYLSHWRSTKYAQIK